MKTLENTFKAVQAASRELVSLPAEKINEILAEIADIAIEKTGFILEENQKDLNRMDQKRSEIRSFVTFKRKNSKYRARHSKCR